MDSGRSPSRRGAAASSGPVIPIEPVLSHYGVELGSQRWGQQQVLCPVHGERRPSLTVNVEEGVAFCFSCQFKGTALHLVMAMESCGREEAQKRLDEILRAAGHEPARRAGGRYQRPGEGRAQTGRTRYVPPGKRSA